MTSSTVLNAVLATIPGRCPECQWSVLKHGHAPDCGGQR